MIVALLPSEIARLVLNYLDEECFKQTYKTFLKECNYLDECKQYLERGICLPNTIHGKTLKEYLTITIQSNTAATPAISELPKLKHSVSTQTACMETRTTSTETMSDDNYAQDLIMKQSQANTPINDYTPTNQSQASLATTPNQYLYNSNNTSGISYSHNTSTSNKRKFDIHHSPASSSQAPTPLSTIVDKNTSVNGADTENMYCYSAPHNLSNNQSNNSTPKKRRLIIGKNTEKVPELSISTIERHLEMLAPTNTIGVVNNSAAMLPITTNNVNNNNSVVLLNDNCNTSINNEDMYDLNNTTITNVLQNQSNNNYQAFIDPANEEAQLFFESFIKNNLSTPQKQQLTATTSSSASYVAPFSLNTPSILNPIDTNLLSSQSIEEKKQEPQRKSNSEIIITKIPQTRSQSHLQKMQEGLQMKLQSSLLNNNRNKAAAAGVSNTIIVNPIVEMMSPNRTTYKLVTENSVKMSSLNTQQQNDFDIRSTSNSASSSPNICKKKRVYNRKTPTIRKMMDSQTPVDSNSGNTDTSTTLTDFFRVKLDDKYNKKQQQQPCGDLTAFTPPSTNGENEDSSSNSHDSTLSRHDRY